MADTHIKIKPVTPRVQYTANGSTTVFPYSFAIFDETDMVVYVDDDIITTGYTVSGAGQTDGGNVTFDSAPVDGTIITLLRNVPIERMTDFQEGGTFRPKNLNDEFDRQTAFAQQVQEALSRCVKVDPTSESTPEEILPKIERLYDSADNIDIVANDKANVDAVAGNQTNIDAVAGNESNINTVAGISSDVSTVAGNATDVSNVATNMSDVNDCATNMAAIQDAPNQAQAAADGAALSAQYANDKINQTHISNCITYIPQDIKLELNNGTLTLKAGSKVYVPNGFEQDGTTPKFDVITIESDILQTSAQANGVCTLYYNTTNNTLNLYYTSSESSGTSAPSGDVTFYNTSTNNIYRYAGGAILYKCSLPLAHITDGTSTIKSIDQVFNGFGYIGSTVFALPGVKGLIPNGRNEDGTLKNIDFEANNLILFTDSYQVDGSLCYALYEDNTISNYLLSGLKYNEQENMFYYNGHIVSDNIVVFANYEAQNSGKITSFTPKTVFHAVDWNDKETIVGWGIPDMSRSATLSGCYQTPVLATQNMYVWGALASSCYFYVNTENSYVTNDNAKRRFGVTGQWSSGNCVVPKGCYYYTNAADSGYGNLYWSPLKGE